MHGNLDLNLDSFLTGMGSNNDFTSPFSKRKGAEEKCLVLSTYIKGKMTERFPI